jgi:hypothetical protein
MSERTRQILGMAVVLFLFAVLWTALVMNAKP